MIQPECFDGVVVIEPDTLPPQPPERPGVPAAWFLLGLFLALVVFELWALHTGHNTVSHLLQRVFRGHPWLRMLSLLGWLAVGWHLFWGFP